MVVADTVVGLAVVAIFYALLALGMNIKYGHTGLLDFGHVGFYLVGAYTAALLVLPPESGGPDTVYLFGLDLPGRVGGLLGFLPPSVTGLVGWLLAILAATVLAGIVGAFVALPTLRLREDYLAITVLGVSVIFQRVVQAESWLANGPDALRGEINRPMAELFPLDGSTLGGAVAFMFISGAVWAVCAWALGRTLETGPDDVAADGARADGSGDGRSTFVSRLHALVTFGADRTLGERGGSAGPLGTLAGIGRDRHVGSALIAGTVAGVVGGVLAITLPMGMLVWGTVVSVFTWLVALVWLARFGAGFDATDYLATLALGAAYMAALAPMYFLSELALWLPLTALAFAAVIGATLYLSRNWPRFAEKPFRYGTFAGLWFGFIWYLPIQMLDAVLGLNLGTAANVVFDSTVWMLSFDGDPTIGYSRFMLFFFGALLFVALYFMELTVNSPFGRVLRAVRNDEEVVNSLGKDPFMFKIQSMALGSALGGLAGALATMYYQVLVFTMFSPQVTFIALLMMFLGGLANNRAMIVGAFLFWAFQTATVELAGFVAPGLRENIQAFRFVVMGILFLALLYYRPQGIMGEPGRTEMGGSE